MKTSECSQQQAFEESEDIFEKSNTMAEIREENRLVLSGNFKKIMQ
jgi:hypothetical protein